MIKFSYNKILSIFFIMFIFAAKAFCAQNTNTLSEINIDAAENNIININLLFKNTYKDRAFLQKQQDGTYSIFLPNTTPQKNTKVTYKNIIDKNKIRLTIEGKTAIKDEKNYSYTKISTDINKNYGIKLISKTQQKTIYGNYALWAVVLLLMIMFIKKSRKNTNKKQIRSESYTIIPESFPANSFEISYNKQKENTENTKTFNFKNNATFDCFNIPQNRVENTNAYEFKSMLQQTSNAMSNKLTTITHKTTNPIITKETKNDDSELKIPLVSDFFTPIEIKEKKEQNSNINLVSVLNITPNKGFYLTSLDDSIALFGFVNNNIFLFNKFKDLTQINLQARFYDKNGNNDIYIVRLDSFKAMIEISETSMRELARI